MLYLYIPLLLSKDSLAKGEAEINFKSNTMTILDEQIPLCETKSGHLLVPVCRSLEAQRQQSYVKRILLNSSIGGNTVCDKDIKKQALKLHRQFAHPPAYRLQKLLKDGGVDLLIKFQKNA